MHLARQLPVYASSRTYPFFGAAKRKVKWVCINSRETTYSHRHALDCGEPGFDVTCDGIALSANLVALT